MANQDSWGHAPNIIGLHDGKKLRITLSGCKRWAVETLINFGKRGCTPIETITETNEGPFQGVHARYSLREQVTKEGAFE